MAGRIAYLGNISTQGLVLDLDAGIMGSYPKTGSTWFDISNNRNNGTLTNGPTFTGSDYGAIVFDGVNDYITGSSSPSFAFGTGDFTVSQWVYLNNFTGSTFVDLRTNTVGNGPGFSGGCTSTGKYALYWSSAFRYTSSGSLTTGSWYHVVATRQSSRLLVYFNSSPDGIAIDNTNLTENGFRLGRNVNATGTGYLNGRIANTQIYNQALSQFQIWQNFNAYKSRYGIPDIVADGLILNLDAGNPYSYLSGSSGTTWSNTVAVSSSISGTLTNGPVYSNGYITCDGTNDYIRVNKISSMSNFTLSFWFRVSSFSGESFLTITSNDAQGPGFGGSGNRLTWWDGSVASGVYGVGTTFLQTNKVYNAVYVRNNTTGIKTIYLNTQIEFTGSAVNTFPNVDFSMGYYPEYNRGALNGVIYSSQIYNRALSQEEIIQNFNALRGRYGI